MTLTAVAFFFVGFVAAWLVGRYVTRGAAVIQSAVTGLCGLAAVFIGMPGVVAESFIWALTGLIVYGLIGALIFRSAQGMRERAE